MPWPAYAILSDADTDAIITYLRNIAPIEHKVPNAVTPGTRTDEKYVHFGVYYNSAAMDN
jgi:hypothetical protein